MNLKIPTNKKIITGEQVKHFLNQRAFFEVKSSGELCAKEK